MTDNGALRELRDELKDLNHSLKVSSIMSEKFTGAMFLLTIVQLLLAGFQLILSFVYPENTLAKEILGTFMILSAFGILAYFFQLLDLKNNTK